MPSPIPHVYFSGVNVLGNAYQSKVVSPELIGGGDVYVLPQAGKLNCLLQLKESASCVRLRLQPDDRIHFSPFWLYEEQKNLLCYQLEGDSKSPVERNKEVDEFVLASGIFVFEDKNVFFKIDYYFWDSVAQKKTYPKPIVLGAASGRYGSVSQTNPSLTSTGSALRALKHTNKVIDIFGEVKKGLQGIPKPTRGCSLQALSIRLDSRGRFAFSISSSDIHVKLLLAVSSQATAIIGYESANGLAAVHKEILEELLAYYENQRYRELISSEIPNPGRFPALRDIQWVLKK